jgi:16S rRNA (cytosine967-C5)-methyltransferase
VQELNVKQASILKAAAALVKKGGRLVYATCSLLEAENEAIVEGFLAARPEFVQLSAAGVLDAQGIALADTDAAPALRLLPHRHGTDGFFAAVMERR